MSIFTSRTHIDDAEVNTVDDLRRCYPLAAQYEYRQTPEGDIVVARLADGAMFEILCEDGMLGFDVPTPGGKQRKVTVEVFKA